MSKVQMIYTSPTGDCRLTTGEIDKAFPNYIINKKDKQAHSISSQGTFVMGRTEKIPDVTLLETMKPPTIGNSRRRPLALCEEGNPWPYSASTPPTEMEKYMEREIWLEEGTSRASDQASMDDMQKETANKVIMVCAGIMAVGTLIMGGIILQNHFSKPSEPPALQAPQTIPTPIPTRSQ